MGPIPSDHDGLLLRLDASGRWLEFSTFLGGPGQDSALGVASDRDGNAAVVGSTVSGAFVAMSNGSLAPGPGGGDDGYVLAVGPDGALRSSGTIGGSAWDEARAVFSLADRTLLIVGQTTSPDFPAESATGLGAEDGDTYWDVPFMTRVDALRTGSWTSLLLGAPPGAHATSADSQWSNRIEAIASDGVSAWAAGTATSWVRRDNDWVPTGTTRYLRKFDALTGALPRARGAATTPAVP